MSIISIEGMELFLLDLDQVGNNLELGLSNTGGLDLELDCDIELIDSEIKTTVNQDNGITTITLSADTLHRFVWLKYKDERFSDNFFHALPNRSVTITMTSQDDVSEIRRNLKVRSLISTYMDKDVTG